jgi:hypothetical protein
MPTLNHAAFIARLKGRSIDTVALRDAHPDLSISGIAGDGIIEGTTQNLERLWEAIDRYDHDGNVNTISDRPALSIAEWLFTSAGSQASVNDTPVNWQEIAELGDKSITENCRAHRAAIDKTGVGL